MVRDPAQTVSALRIQKQRSGSQAGQKRVAIQMGHFQPTGA